FGLQNDVGLSTLLCSGGADVGSCVFPTNIPGLFALTSGPLAPGASNLLHSQRMAELLRHFRKEFDALVIDTPPVLPFSDARPLARLADGVILVLRAGRTSLFDAMFARQRLCEDGTNILGAVLTDCNRKSNPTEYYYDYY